VQDIRDDELSWFRRAQLLAAVYFLYLCISFKIDIFVQKLTCEKFYCASYFFLQNRTLMSLRLFLSFSCLLQLNSFILNSIPVIVTVVSFGVYSLLGGDLTPAKAFTSLSLFAVLRFPLFMLPNLITQVCRIMFSFLL
jgi:hypothetical protein